VPDLHFPFAHKKALDFCKKVYKEYNCDNVVFVGDMFDHHQMSRHTSEPDALGAKQEANKAQKMVNKWVEAFPVADIMLGNHDLIPKRQGKEVGLIDRFIRTVKEAYGLPDGWKFHNKLVRNKVLYLHIAGSGKYAAMNKAREQSMSVVAGHTHKHPGTLYFSNPRNLYYGMNVGCLINKKAYAMRYSDAEITLGVGVVYGPTHATFVPMPLK